MRIKKIFLLIFLSYFFAGCSEKKTPYEYPVIDVVGSVEKYQRVYCSELFSSIDLIPLETEENCLLDAYPFPRVLLKDSFIFYKGSGGNFVFSTSGKFLGKIGKSGQGPDEFIASLGLFLNTEKPTAYIEDHRKILEYDFYGNFIRSVKKPVVEDVEVTYCSYVVDGLFIGQIYYDGKRSNKYSLFDQNGDVVKNFPSQVFFDRAGNSVASDDAALTSIQVEKKLYLKDYFNDTLYILENLNLQPAYVFGLGAYTYPKENLERRNKDAPFPLNAFTFSPGLGIVGTPEFFFYKIRVPDFFSKPKAKPIYNLFLNEFRPDDSSVYGIYNITKKNNILLDTDKHLQKGIINDINGGLPLIPRYYAGNGIVVDVWYPEDMKEMLTDEYFASQTIKDQQAHQKLKEILKNLKDDDNPIVVVARLK